jgi:DNA repair exonuclease SbcCD ATPase subunit
MEQRRYKFPDDQDNRIQKLYYDADIKPNFNKTKLRNLKNKFCRYENYITKKHIRVIQPKLLELQKIRHDVDRQEQRLTFFYLHNPTLETIEKKKALIPIFRKAEEEYEDLKAIACEYTVSIEYMHTIINAIKKQQRNIYKHYRKCSHCEKMAMVAISGCKSKHKLCSDCSDDITECPVCKEDLGLVHCYICYEYKKELVDTGCENKHQTCKECLDKIIRKNNICPFCRDYCCKEQLAVPDYWRERSEEEDDVLAQEWTQVEYSN